MLQRTQYLQQRISTVHVFFRNFSAIQQVGCLCQNNISDIMQRKRQHRACRLYVSDLLSYLGEQFSQHPFSFSELQTLCRKPVDGIVCGFYQQQTMMLHFTYDAWSYVMALIPFHFIATFGNNPLIFSAQKCSCTDGER